MPTTLRNSLHEDDANEAAVEAQEFTLLDESGENLTLEAEVVSDFLTHVDFDGVFANESASLYLLQVDGDGDYVHYFEEEADDVEEGETPKKGLTKGMADDVPVEEDELDEAAMAKVSTGKPSYAGTKISKWPTRHEKKVYPAAYHDEEDEDEESHVKEDEAAEAAKKDDEKGDKKKPDEKSKKDGDDDKDKKDDEKSESTTRGLLLRSMAYETIEEDVEELKEGEYLQFLPGDVVTQLIDPNDLVGMFEHYIGTLLGEQEWGNLTLSEKAKFYTIANLLGCAQDEGVFEAATEEGRAQFLDIAHALLSSAIVRHSTPVNEAIIKKRTASARAATKRAKKKPKSGKRKLALKLARKKGKRADVKAKRARTRRKKAPAIRKRAKELRRMSSEEIPATNLIEYPIYGDATPNGAAHYEVATLDDVKVTFEVIEAAKKTSKKDDDKTSSKADDAKGAKDKEAKDKGDDAAKADEEIQERQFLRAGPALVTDMIAIQEATQREADERTAAESSEEGPKKPDAKVRIDESHNDQARVSDGSRLAAGMIR